MNLRYVGVCVCVFATPWDVQDLGSIPQGSNLGPLQWKCCVLTIGPLGRYLRYLRYLIKWKSVQYTLCVNVAPFLLVHSLNIYLTGSYCVLESCRKGGLETAGGWWGGAEMLGREDWDFIELTCDWDLKEVRKQVTWERNVVGRENSKKKIWVGVYLEPPRDNKEAIVSAGKIARRNGGDERSYMGLIILMRLPLPPTRCVLLWMRYDKIEEFWPHVT